VTTAATLSLVAITGFDLLIGQFLLLAGTSRGLGARRILVSLGVVIGLACLEVGVIAKVFSRGFFAINTAYCDTFIVVPLCALTLLALRRKVLTGPAWALVIAGLALAPVGIYATFIEPQMLVTEEVDVPLARGPSEPLRVAVLADMQFTRVGDHERAAVARAMEFDPHLIVLPGDVLQVRWRDYGEHEESVRELLRPLAAPLGVYLVRGNVEPQQRHIVEGLLVGTNVRYLVSEAVHVDHAGTPVTIAGIDLAFRSRRSRELLAQLEQSPGDDLRLLISHVPDVVADLGRPSRFDLVIAGHTHGGQVSLPWFGPPITLTMVPRHIGAGGLHPFVGTHIYVSRGVGCERGHAPRVRFNAPPEVSWLTLRRDAAP